MGELWKAGELARSMMVIATTVGFPPFSSGAFWGILSLWGLVTILFDDETPRGIPGIEHLSAHPRPDTQGEHT
jgi:hypothetical protein